MVLDTKKESPIIFGTWAIPKLKDNSKTQTRRVIKPQPLTCEGHTPNWQGQILDWIGYKYSNREHWFCHTCGIGLRAIDEFSSHGIICPYGQVGDRLWLKHRYDLFDTYYAPIDAPTGGWHTAYAAGTDGHIYRMDKGEPRILKEAPTGDKGYLAVTLSDGSYKSTQLVHRLVVKAFYGLPPADLYQTQTRHLDGNNQNNLPSNLDWGTQEDNWLDRKYHGRGMGEAHHAAKLTHSQAVDIRLSFKSQRQLASIYNVSQATIQAITSNKLWQTKPPQPSRNYPAWNGWESPLFMPRWASRITLETTEIRVERVQEISEDDAEREGESWEPSPTHSQGWNISAVENFSILWDSINAKRGYGWNTNPFVWCISFKVIDK